MEFNIKISNGLILKGMIKSPGEHTRSVVILVHGLGEHIQRYTYWAELFKKEGFGFIAVDLPGHGLSQGRRGYISSYLIIHEMLDILIKSCNQTFPGCPVYIYGHSLGGGIVLDYLLKRKPKVKGAIVTSPWLRLTSEPSKSKKIMASVIRYLLPGLIQPTGLNVSHISHDEEIVVKYVNDPLVHDKISVSLYSGAMEAARYSLSHARELQIPTLILHGSDDLITSSTGSREFAEKSQKVHLKVWEGGYHELHNEPFKDEVFKFIIDWISKN